MLNKDYYYDRLNEIAEALENSDNWYNVEEYVDYGSEKWWEGFWFGFVTPFMIASALLFVAVFINWAVHF